ncbi:hypothetical protein ACOMHN_016199 [Nucella lapillus]
MEESSTNATFGDTHFGNDSLYDPEFYDSRIVSVEFWLALVTIPSLACLGIVGNIITIIVWHTDRNFNASVFLFKNMAVWDIVYLGTVIGYSIIIRDDVLSENEVLESSLDHTKNFAQLVSTHVTLLLAVSRWIAVTYPFNATCLLTSTRIYRTSVFILLYCAILETAQVIFNSYNKENPMVFVIKRVFGLALPFLFLFIFNISLLWTASRCSGQELEQIEMRGLSQGQDQTSRTCVRSSQGSDLVSLETEVPETTGDKKVAILDSGEERKQRPAQQQRKQEQRKHKQQIEEHEQKNKKQQQKSNAKTQVRRLQSSQRRKSRKQMMVKAVLLVSLCSFVAYPVGNSVQVYFIESPEPSLLAMYIAVNVTHAIQVLNHGINVVIYWFFVSKFKELAQNLPHRLSTCLRCASTSNLPN